MVTDALDPILHLLLTTNHMSPRLKKLLPYAIRDERVRDQTMRRLHYGPQDGA